jgi:predicted ATP-binding protein involved in virulence
MYIRKIEIKNIRSIANFSMEFPEDKEAGWHVLIGDNGAGKSTILQSMAMGLIGPEEVLRLNPAWESWVKKGQDQASIEIIYRREDKPDLPDPIRSKNEAHISLSVIRGGVDEPFFLEKAKGVWQEGGVSHKGKRFSCGFGPFRRFTGGDILAEDQTTPLTPFETLFRPEVILTSSLTWIKDQYTRSFEDDKKAQKVLNIIKNLIASGSLLPNQLKIDKITADGVFFKDADGVLLHISELSDGVKSILALTFELCRLLFDKYNISEVNNNMLQSGVIDVAGVVLIDEIDAHLHPTWQTRIGQWFTYYFPNLQFIVTTHSPLICRACEKGSIWRLAAPGNDRISGEVTGEDKDKLIYGDVLDAYETDVFGAKITRGEEGREKQDEYRSLVYKENYGQKMSAEEKRQLKHLKTIFHTDVALDT